MAVADLGGLGAKEGPPAAYHWTLPSRLPPLLPWLGILLLLAAKPNRCARAWWIWAPLLLLAGVAELWQAGLLSLPSRTLNQFLDLIIALAFGVAAVWLLATWLQRPHRFLTFLTTAVVLAGGGLLAMLVRQGGSLEQGQETALAVAVAATAAALSAALGLTGLLCRRRYGGLRVLLWLIALLLATWLVVVAPFAIHAAVTSNGGPTFFQYLMVVLVLTGISFGTVLPFLVLSFTSGFYRERLQALLDLQPGAPAPVLTPPSPAAATPVN